MNRKENKTMTTHIRMLRPYTYKGEKKLADKDYKNLFCKDINYLFNEGLEPLMNMIPKEDKFNLFYTACTIESREMTRKDGKKYTNKRAFVDQEVIPFDIDHVCIEQIESYPIIVSQVLKIPLNEMIVIHTGNGIQVIVKSAVKITELSYFKEHIESYKKVCTDIQLSMQASGLAGDVDTSVFSPGRLLRLPMTENRKPMLDPHGEFTKSVNATLTEYRTLGGSGLLLDRDNPLTKHNSKKSSTNNTYTRPDVDFIKDECVFIKKCLSGDIDVHEPECYAFLGITSFLEDEDETSWQGLNKFSSPTIDNMDKQSKIDQARDTQSGPRTCEDIAGRSSACNSCKHYGKINTPLQLKRPDFNLSLAYNGELGTKPSEIEVVAFVLARLGIPFDTSTGQINGPGCPILKEGVDLDPLRKDYFHWNGKFWQQLEQADLMNIEALIRKAYNFQATSAKCKATLKGLLELIPFNTSSSFFTHQIDKTNFSNGTLTAVPNGNGTYKPTFTDQSKLDRLTYTLPTPYSKKAKYDPAGPFGKMIDRVFDGDFDKEEKIQCLKEMFGASLMPIFPRVFFLQGRPGTGKSTLLKILSYLVGQENLAHVELTGKSDFNLEDIVGYNVNLVTDIDENEPIRINVIKQIEDRLPVRINRKFRSSVIAPLPPIHIFGANSMPPLYEKSGALGRRTSVLILENSFTKGEEKLKPEERKSIKEFASVIFDSDRENITAFAIEGIHDLITKNAGHYTNPQSGLDKTNEWMTDKDPIQRFLNEIKDQQIEGLQCSDDEADKVKCSEFYNKFHEWCLDEHGGENRFKPTNRTDFFNILASKGNKRKLFKGIYYIRNFKVSAGDNF